MWISIECLRGVLSPPPHTRLVLLRSACQLPDWFIHRCESQFEYTQWLHPSIQMRQHGNWNSHYEMDTFHSPNPESPSPQPTHLCTHQFSLREFVGKFQPFLTNEIHFILGTWTPIAWHPKRSLLIPPGRVEKPRQVVVMESWWIAHARQMWRVSRQAERLLP